MPLGGSKPGSRKPPRLPPPTEAFGAIMEKQKTASDDAVFVFFGLEKVAIRTGFEPVLPA